MVILLLGQGREVSSRAFSKTWMDTKYIMVLSWGVKKPVTHFLFWHLQFDLLL
jgi:hypothetical protein